MSYDDDRPSFFRRWLRRFFFAIGGLVLAFVVVIVGFFAYTGAFYNRFVMLPRAEKDIALLQSQTQPVTLDDGWNEYRAVLHTHSKFSHDSSVPLERVLEAAKNVGVDAMFMTDHCVEGHADFSLQWQGIYDDVLFVRGFEMSEGFLLWNMPEDTNILCMMQPEQIAQMAAEKQGMLFYAHSEEDRLWDLEQYGGMEIYNIHTDLKDENYALLIPNILFCYKAFPTLAMRILMDRHPEILARWDRQNEIRPITGIAASDAHQNNGIRLIYNADGRFELWEAGPKFVATMSPFMSGLLKLLYRPSAPGETVLNFYIDPYENSISFVNTHVLARELTQESLVESLRAGRAFVAFNHVAPAEGFTFIADDGANKATMGERIPYSPTLKLRAEAPLTARVLVVKDGQTIHTEETRTLEFTPDGPGQYRLELEQLVAGEWTPWIYSNRIRVE